jgi:hypothetical protein
MRTTFALACKEDCCFFNNSLLSQKAVFFAKFCYLALKISLYQRLFRVIPILLYLLAQCRKPDTKIGSYLFSSQPTRQRNTDCLMSKFCRAFRSPSRSPFAHNMQLKERHNSATGPRTSSSKPPEPAAIWFAWISSPYSEKASLYPAPHATLALKLPPRFLIRFHGSLIRR